MARVKPHGQVTFHMDTRQLEASMNEIGAFTEALGQTGYWVAKHVFDKFKHGFLRSVDTAAMMSAGTDPRGQGSFHHLYEPYEAGNPAERLFDLVVPQEVRNRRGAGQIYGRIDYKASTEREQPFGVLRTGNFNARYHEYRTVPFWNKAMVLEEGLDVTVPEGNSWVVRGGVRGYAKSTGRPIFREGLQLVTSTKTTTQSTKNLNTYRALMRHYQQFLRGGLANTAVVSALTEIDQQAVRRTINQLEFELDKYRQKYAAGRTGAMGDRSGINRGKVFGFSAAGRNHINKKYIRLLESNIQRLRGALDDIGG